MGQYLTTTDIRPYQQYKRLAAYHDKVARLMECDLRLHKINRVSDWKASIEGLMDDCAEFLRGVKRRKFLKWFRGRK